MYAIRSYYEWIDLHLFLLNPCEAHWADIVPLKTQAKLELRHPSTQLYLEVGHPLLASLGRQGRDFFAAINELDPGDTPDFEPATGDRLLQHLQNQILWLQTPEPASIRADDSRITSYNVCYTKLLRKDEEERHFFLRNNGNHVAYDIAR